MPRRSMVIVMVVAAVLIVAAFAMRGEGAGALTRLFSAMHGGGGH